MLRLLIASAILFVLSQALRLEENHPGPIPFLSREVNNVPGGWAKVDLNNRAKVDRLARYANNHINKLQMNKPPGSPRHTVIKIKEAIQQVLPGIIYKIVFTVGQLNDSPPRDVINGNGQYGGCYFKIKETSSSPATTELLHEACIKIPKAAAV